MSSVFLFLFFSLGIRGFPGAVGSHWNLHAWQNSHSQDLLDPDLQSSLVAEDSREHCHGSVSGSECGFCFLIKMCFIVWPVRLVC